MKSIFNILAAVTLLSGTVSAAAQIKHSKTETVKVYGNCDMCKKNIESAAYSKKVSMADWNKDTKTAVLTFDSTKTNADALLKKIALAGYDNQNYLAPDQAYSKLASCCQYERKPSKSTMTHSDHSGMSHNMGSASMQEVTPQSQEQNNLSAVYTAYFEIKDALIKGDGNAAASKAKDLYKAVDNVPMEKLTSSQHMVWMKYMKDISYNAEHIKSTTDTDHQREHFAKLSVAMYEVMKVIKAEYPVYYDHCPMYNDGKGGDWLSKETAIKNPYYGSQMLSCGSTKETIK